MASKPSGPREGGCQERMGKGDTLPCSLSGTFFDVFVCTLFRHIIKVLSRMMAGIKTGSICLHICFEKTRKSKSAFRLHMRARFACEPLPWNAQHCSKVHPKHTRRSQKPVLLGGESKHHERVTSNFLNKWFYIVRTALGRALAHH